MSIEQEYGRERESLLGGLEEWMESESRPDARDLISEWLAGLDLPLHESTPGEGLGSIESSSSLFLAATGGGPLLTQGLRFGEIFELVAGPRERLLESLEAGDLLIREAFGEGSWAHAAVLASGEVVSDAELAADDLSPESDGGGYFAQVLEVHPRLRLRRHRFARSLGG